MMKIGIVTPYDLTNYGNRLQNYALYYVLKTKFHCEAKTLVPYEMKPYDDRNYIAWLKKQIIRKACIFPEFAEKRFGTTITRWAAFLNWDRKISTNVYYQHKKLPVNIKGEFDYFFCGSDQVWNYRFSSPRFEDYFLKFADSKQKVAISASFGLDEIPDGWKETYVDGLADFAHISVREEAGQRIIQELFGINVPVLIDPVMMLSKEEWIKVSKKPRVDCSKSYILKYYLGGESEKDRIDEWAKTNGYEIYELLNDSIPELYSAGPGEFISLISHAAMICSDSFHCIAFSIIFSRPFIVFERQGKANCMKSRLETLLNKFGFQNRWKHLLNESEYLSCDYSNVDERLKMEQKKFLEYIRDILK